MPTSPSINLNQKGFAHIFVVLLLLIGVGAGIYLVQHPAIFKPRADQNRLCTANSVASFRDCINKVNANQIDNIEVQNMITCNKGDNCAFTIQNVLTRPILIQGKKGVQAGFKRINWYDGHVLSILNSQNIYIGNLTFDDNKDIRCYIFSNWTNNQNTNYCQQRGYSSGVPGAAIFIHNNSKNVTLDNLKTLYFKHNGIEVQQTVEDTIIQNSTFQNGGTSDADGRPLGSGWFGLYANTKNINIINNKFLSIQSNAILLDTNSTPNKRSKVKGNLFKDSAEWDIFNSGGGTVGILSPFTYTDIEYNEIVDAQAAKNILTGTTSYNGGIEIDVLDSKAISHDNNIIGNVIHNIEGQYGIGIGDKQYYSNYNIRNNVVYDIRDFIRGHAGEPIMLQEKGTNINVTNNCFNASCPIPAYSTFTAFPDVCFQGSDGRCSSTITWSSKSLGNLTLKDHKTGTVLGAVGANGSFDFSWKNDGEGVDLIANNKPIDSFVVSDGKLIQTIPYKGAITAVPASCTLGSNSLCEVTINWDVSNDFPSGSTVLIKADGADFNGGKVSGSAKAPWINSKGVKFDLYVNGQLYDSFVVKGTTANTTVSGSPSPATKRGTLTASPNPCKIATGTTYCVNNPAKITWKANVPVGSAILVKIKETGVTFAGGAPSGSADAWFIPESGYNLELWVNGELVDSIFVKGEKENSARATPSPRSNQSPIGIFDGVYGSQLIGWSCDLDAPTTPTTVHIYVDDQFGWADKADKTGEAGIGSNCGGYKDRRIITSIPNKYNDGKAHSVKIYALDNITTGTNTLLNGSPKSFTLGSIATPTPAPIVAYKGNVAAVPSTCKLGSNSLCEVTINWDVSNAYPIGVTTLIKADGTDFAGGGLRGSATAPWINSKGVKFDLYVNGQLYDSVVVKGTP